MNQPAVDLFGGLKKFDSDGEGIYLSSDVFFSLLRCYLRSIGCGKLVVFGLGSPDKRTKTANSTLFPRFILTMQAANEEAINGTVQEPSDMDERHRIAHKAYDLEPAIIVATWAKHLQLVDHTDTNDNAGCQY